MTKHWPADRVERRPIEALLPYARNARTHSEAQVAQIAASMKEWGWTNPVLVDEAGMIIAGHGRVLAARQLGLDQVPVMTAVGWTEAQKAGYVLADNQLALNAGWDMGTLKNELLGLKEWEFDLSLLGFADLDALMADKTAGLTDPDAVPDLPEVPVTRKGDLWICGKHRLLADSASSEAGLAHLNGADLVCTDPPYCSGGFQEGGKSVGSVGTSAKHKQIANDRLSTRGYQSLIKSAVFALESNFFYVFTDWRMWTYLYDLAEGSGAGVRSMIAWNKGTPGMGLGWRSQHELVLWACRVQPPYPKGFGGLGNVISLSRQKNELHTTQKPVELMQTLLKGVPFVRSVADPFAGSGSTLIACEIEGKACRATELDMAYVDVAVKRWQDFTGREAVHEDGHRFNEAART